MKKMVASARQAMIFGLGVTVAACTGPTAEEAEIGSIGSAATASAAWTWEAEAMTVSGNAFEVFGDGSAKGGKTLGLWTNATASIDVTTTGTVTGFSVRAKASLCNGAPSMSVKVDGKTVTTQNVTSTAWSDYGTSLPNLAAGKHHVEIAFTNDASGSGCDRNLFLDQGALTGSSGGGTTTPPPTTPSTFELGRRPFAASSSWNTKIPDGATYTPLGWPASTGYNYWVNWDEYAPAIHVSRGTDPVVRVAAKAGWGYPAETVEMRLPVGASGAPGSDGEVLAIDGTTVHNCWRFVRTSNTTATCEAYGRADVVSGSGWGTRSPFLGAGIVAAGASQLAGLLVQAETDRGEIEHALQMAVSWELQKPTPVGEAISSDGGSSTGIAQEGDRFALPSSMAMPAGLSPLGQKVFRAMKTYGVFDIDVAGGTTILRAQANAYDRPTIDALRKDVNKLIPALQRVRL